MAGRPTEYKEEYNEQVYKLCLLGAKDKELADFFNVEEKREITRGKSLSLSTTTIKNSGYSFVGWTINKNASPSSTLTVTMDKMNPGDITVYMVFEKIQYTIQVIRDCELTLTTNTTPQETVRALNQISLDKAGSNSEIKLGKNISWTSNTFTFETTLSVDDKFNYTINLNSGFMVAHKLENNEK